MVGKIERRYRSKLDAITDILGLYGKPMNLDELISKAQELHPIKRGEQEWRAFIKWNANKFGEIRVDIKDNVVSMKKWSTPEATQTVLPIVEEEPKGNDELKTTEKLETKEPELELQEEIGNGIPLIKPNPGQFILRSCPPFVDDDSLMELVGAHLLIGGNLLIRGVKGVAKTLMFSRYAFENEIPIFQVDCSETMKRGDLIGRFTAIGNEVKYILGALPGAISVANQCGTALLIGEEFNAQLPNSQKIWNQLLDFRKHVFVPELNRTFRLNPGVKLLVGATMNPSTYGGVHEINEDLKSRFSILDIGYPGKTKERKIINIRGKVSTELVEHLLNIAKETRDAVGAGDVTYAISPRDTHQFLDNLKIYRTVFDEEKAMKMALTTAFVGKYETEEEKVWVRNRIDRIMGVMP